MASESRLLAITGAGSEDLMVKGPWFRPWTFWAYSGKNPVGKITKRFSGIGREIATDADMFDVEFLGLSSNQDQRMRLLLMGFVVDMKYFEGKGNRGFGSIIGR